MAKIIDIKKKKDRKIRVNITVDSALLKEAKTKLHLFGGKLSTLFNAYLRDFVKDMEKEYDSNKKIASEKIKELEKRLADIERKIKNHRVIKKISFEVHGHQFSFFEKVSAFTLSDFEEMLEKSGFEIKFLFGDYHLNTFDTKMSPRLIIKAIKT